MKIKKILFVVLVSVVMSTNALAGKDVAREHQFSNKKSITHLQVLATIGPLAYLSGATITVKNANNVVIAKHKTTLRGVASFHLPAKSLTHQPLKIISSGGQIVYPKSDLTKLKTFHGQLKTEQTEVTVGSTVVIALDFMSTIANGLVTKKTSYADALSKVRAAFEIPDKVSHRVFSYSNQYVDLTALEKAVKKHKGYNNYVNYIITQIKFGNSFTELKPSLNPKSVAAKAATLPPPAEATAETGAFPTCPAIGDTSLTTNSTNNSSVSTSIFTDLAYLAIDGLLFSRGLGTTWNSGLNGLAGTALSIGATSVAAPVSTSSPYTAIFDQLQCINSQLEYLNGQTLQTQIDVEQTTALTCQTVAIFSAWPNYQAIIGAATPTVNPTNGVITMPAPTESLNPPTNNSTFLDNYGAWGALNGLGAVSNGDVTPTCGAILNSTLFSPGGDETGTWLLINQQMQSLNLWYTTPQVQGLQQYLNTWGMVLYQEFVLFSEYLNYTQATDAIVSEKIGSITGGSACDPSVTTEGGTFCTWANTIKNAYPPSLYSDEIAIPSNGLAVIPYPTSQALNLAATSPYSGVSGINANYFGEDWVSGIGVNCSNYAVCNNVWQYGDLDVNGTSYSPSPQYAAATAPSSAVYNPSLTSIFGTATTEANKTLLNAQGGYSPSLSTTENSSVETYTTPQVPHTQVITSTQLPNLGSLSNGQSALTLFYNAINQDNPTSPLWSGLTATEIAYFTSDNIVTVTDQAVASNINFADNLTNANNQVVGCVTGKNGNSVGSINGQNCNQLQVQMDAYLNGSTPILQNCGDDECTNAGNPSATYPIMAQLLGRTWWAGAASATQFVPPTPLTPAPAPTIIGASINGASVDVGFLLLSTTTTPTITSYTATCQNSNGTVSVTGTSSPIEVTAPAPVNGVTTPAGGAITCFVQALNGGGSGYQSASVTAAVGALPLICQGQQAVNCSQPVQDCGSPIVPIYIPASATSTLNGAIISTGTQCEVTATTTEGEGYCKYTTKPKTSCIQPTGAVFE